MNIDNGTNSNNIDPTSTEYSDIKLYSIVAHACKEAGDRKLGEIFYYLMHNVGSTYECNGQQAIDEGEKYVSDYIDMCVNRNGLMEKRHLQQYPIGLLTECAQNGDFSNIIVYQNKQLKEGRAGVTQEGINKLNSHIFKLLDIYKNI